MCAAASLCCARCSSASRFRPPGSCPARSRSSFAPCVSRISSASACFTRRRICPMHFPFIGSCPEQEPNCRDTVRFQAQSSFSSQFHCSNACGKSVAARRRNPVHLTPVRDPAVVLTPGGPRRGSGEIRTGDVAVSSGPGPSQAGKVFFSHVNARAIEAVCLLMVDSLDLETLMSVIP